MAKGIIWTLQAKKEREEILNYWFKITGNKKHSRKLALQFRETVRYLAKYNYLGRPTDINNVRDTIAGDYLMFYKISDTFIEIVSIFDCRRNPEDLDI